MPSALAFPGGMIGLADTVGSWPMMLTTSLGPVPQFSMMSGSRTNLALGTLQAATGTHLQVSQGGSVFLRSDGRGWLVECMSGTLVLTP